MTTSESDSGDLSDAVQASFAGTRDPRLRAILHSLVRHLHAFVTDVEPTIAEWEQAIAYLTRTGQRSDEHRQEFILLSDVLGVSMLVEAINDRKTGAVTDSTVLGPFHVVASPARALGDSIECRADGHGERCVVTGQVRSADGSPLPAALIDVWQAGPDGFYDVQQPELQPPGNGRGLFTADADGRFWFRTVVPRFYPIPTDGPVGELLDATGRHPNRPAHIHFIASAAGHVPVTTHAFVEASPYLDSDAVFAVKASLIRPFELIEDAEQAGRFATTAPFRLASFDIVLAPERH